MYWLMKNKFITTTDYLNFLFSWINYDCTTFLSTYLSLRHHKKRLYTSFVSGIQSLTFRVFLRSIVRHPSPLSYPSSTHFIIPLDPRGKSQTLRRVTTIRRRYSSSCIYRIKLFQTLSVFCRMPKDDCWSLIGAFTLLFPTFPYIHIYWLIS